MFDPHIKKLSTTMFRRIWNSHRNPPLIHQQGKYEVQNLILHRSDSKETLTLPQMYLQGSSPDMGYALFTNTI